jgi:phosphatidylglycerophosphatase A
MSNNNYKKLGEAPWLHVIISTGFGSGFFPGAPGAFAALIALGIWYVLYTFLSPIALTITTLLLIVVVTIIGVWTSTIMEHYWGEDPRTVVIDEYVGMWVPLLVAPCADKKSTLILAFLGFFLFRIIDWKKPLGCRRLEKLPGGYGVMFDDLLAGLYSLIIVLIVRLIFF